MTSLSLDERVGRVEQNQATLVERVAGLTRQLESVAELPQKVALLAKGLEDVVDDLDTLGTSIGAVQSMLEKRDQQASSERNSVKIALISLSGTIIVTILGAVLAFLFS